MSNTFVAGHLSRLFLAFIAIFFLGASLAACSNNEADDASASGGSSERPPAAVVVAEVTEDYLTTTENFFAQVRSRNSASLSPSAPGEVTEVNVREGDRVEEGAVLMRVNSRSASANLQQQRSQLAGIQVQLDQARRDAERARSLADRAIGSGQAAEQAEAQASGLQEQLSSTQASISAQRQAVSDHVVRAPFAGVITSRSVDVGDFIQPGAAVLELVSTDEIEVFVRLPQARIARLDSESAALLRSGGESVEASIEGVVGVLDQATRSGLVRLIPNSSPSWLRPGAAIDVQFDTRSDEKGLIVPLDAVVYGVARPRLMKIVDGSAVPVDIEIVGTSNDQALVRGEGLSVNDQVVIRGNERLRPGQSVSVQPELDDSPGSAPRGQDSPTAENAGSPPSSAQTQDASTGPETEPAPQSEEATQ